jgi:hypothetical protein
MLLGGFGRPPFKGMHSLDKELGPRATRLFLVFASLAGSLILFLYLASLGKLGRVYADRAGPVVYAHEILNGNWRLHNWDLTTYANYHELLFYVPGVAISGMNMDAMRLIPAFIFALNIFLVVCVIWRFSPKPSWWIYLPVLIFLVLPSNGAWRISLEGATHHATTMAMLLCLLLVDKNLEAHGWKRIAYLTIISVVASCSDVSFAYLFVIPTVAAILWTHRLDRHLLRACTATIVLPVVVGSLLGRIAEKGLVMAGFGSAPGTGGLVFERIERLGPKLQAQAETWWNLFGANFFGQPVNMYSLGTLCLGIGAILWLVAAKLSAKRGDAIDRLFISMFACAVLFCTLSYSRGSLEFTRFLLPAFLMAVVTLSRLLQNGDELGIYRGAAVIALAGGLVASSLFFQQNHYLMAGDQYGAWLKEPIAELERRGLSVGFSDYWCGLPIRVASGGKITPVPVVANASGTIDPLHWSASREWSKTARGRYAIFHGDIPDADARDVQTRDRLERAAVATWGTPDERLEIGDLVLLLWREDKQIPEDRHGQANALVMGSARADARLHEAMTTP